MKSGKISISAFSLILAFCVQAVYAIENSDVYAEAMKRGKTCYQDAQYEPALEYFNAVLAEPQAGTFHGDALLWAGKTEIALGSYKDAETNLERFLLDYSNDPGYEEGYYLKGRLLFIQREFEASIEVLQSFLLTFGENEYSPFAYYWIGESLLELGQIDSASKVFTFIVSAYPGNEKAEASTYRINLIELQKKEQELLKLLKWSHEEALRAQEEFAKREKTYEEAIGNYQMRIASIDSTDAKKRLAELSEQVVSLQKQLSDKSSEIEKLTSENSSLRASVLTASGSGAKTAADTGAALKRAMDLLTMKQEALALKAYYLEKAISLKEKTE